MSLMGSLLDFLIAFSITQPLLVAVAPTYPLGLDHVASRGYSSQKAACTELWQSDCRQIKTKKIRYSEKESDYGTVQVY